MATLATCNIFSLELEEQPARSLSLPVGCAAHQLAVKQQRTRLPSNNAGWRLRLSQDIRAIQAAACDVSCDAAYLAKHLTIRGYTVSLRIAAAGGSGQTCFQHLHNTFLMVWDGPMAAVDDACIVDPFFRSHFELSCSWVTPDYAAALPQQEAFIGSFEQLMELTQYLCAEMAAAFSSRGVSLPPWRTIKAMRSMWSLSNSQAVSSHALTLPIRHPDKSEARSARAALPTPANAPLRVSAVAAARRPVQKQPTTKPETRPFVKVAASTPLRVQTGFQVETYQQQPESTPTLVGNTIGKQPTSRAFDMWSHQPRKQAAKSPRTQPAARMPLEDRLSGVMAPVRTVKMCGRSRA